MQIATKSQPVDYYQVARAYRQVKKGGKAVGIDGQSMVAFEKRINDNLYKLWNRMTSGSYMPPGIREHEIPKSDGRKRKLGIPTIGDRIAQRVVKNYMEPRLEKIFLSGSYGYRGGRNAHQAIESCIYNTREYSWVIDLDIQGYFDNIDHELLMQAVRRHFEEKWVLLYVERWLKVPIIRPDGREERRSKGTPQGGVISPLLSNLFLHYVFDAWFSLHYKGLKFERFADDIVVHCRSRQEAEELLTSLRERFLACKLTINEAKTKIAYCKRAGRKESYSEVSFNFLGHCFRPYKARTKRGECFLSFGPHIGQAAAKKITRELRGMQIHRKTGKSLSELAEELNPKIRGWINYFGRYGGNRFNYVLHLLNIRLCKWVKWRYKLRGRTGRVIGKMKRFYEERPKLFAHWCFGIRPIRAK